MPRMWRPGGLGLHAAPIHGFRHRPATTLATGQDAVGAGRAGQAAGCDQATDPEGVVVMSCAVAKEQQHRTWCALWGAGVDFCTCHDVDVAVVVAWHAAPGRRSRVCVRTTLAGNEGPMTPRMPDPVDPVDEVDTCARIALDPAAVIAWWVDQATHGTVDSGHEATGQD